MRQRSLAKSTSWRKPIFAGSVDNQYLVGAVSPAGHVQAGPLGHRQGCDPGAQLRCCPQDTIYRARASWLNQVEIWFSILQAKSLCDESFTSVKQLREHIDNFIAAYNANAKLFAWSKSEVHQKRLKASFADQ